MASSIYTGQARYLDGIPVVPTTAARNSRYASPPPFFRVYNRETSSEEMWSGLAWAPLPGTPEDTGVIPISAYSGDVGQAITAAMAALPASGGTIDARSAGGAQALSAALTITRSNVQILLAPTLQLAMGANSIVVTAGLTGIRISSLSPWGALSDTGAATFYPSSLNLAYTGNGAAISIGDSSLLTRQVILEGLGVDLSGAGASAIAFLLNHTVYFHLNRTATLGKSAANSQVGIKLDGTGTYFTGWGRITHPIVSLCDTGIYGTGSGLNGANQVTVFEGALRCNSGTKGTTGLKLDPATSWDVQGLDMDGFVTGCYVNNNNNTGHHLVLRTENIGTDGVKLDTAAAKNFVHIMTGTATDLGTENLVYRQGAFSSGTRIRTAEGATWESNYATEELTLSTSGTTTDTTANLLPAGAIIESVTARVTVTIGTATDWKVGDPTTAARFSAANATMVAGTTSLGLDQWSGAVTTLAAGPSQAAADKVRITTTGTPSAGKIRLTVFYRKLTAPTS